MFPGSLIIVLTLCEDMFALELNRSWPMHGASFLGPFAVDMVSHKQFVKSMLDTLCVPDAATQCVSRTGHGIFRGSRWCV